MSDGVNQFLKELENQQSENYFLFYSFYLKPSKIFGCSNKESLKEYFKAQTIKILILSNDFLRFLKLCLADENFVENLD